MGNHSYVTDYLTFHFCIQVIRAKERLDQELVETIKKNINSGPMQENTKDAPPTWYWKLVLTFKLYRKQSQVVWTAEVETAEMFEVPG